MENLFLPFLAWVNYFFDAVLMRDFPVVMGILTIGSVLTLFGNLIADIGYAWADPRIRRGISN